MYLLSGFQDDPPHTSILSVPAGHHSDHLLIGPQRTMLSTALHLAALLQQRDPLLAQEVLWWVSRWCYDLWRNWEETHLWLQRNPQEMDKKTSFLRYWQSPVAVWRSSARWHRTQWRAQDQELRTPSPFAAVTHVSPLNWTAVERHDSCAF